VPGSASRAPFVLCAVPADARATAGTSISPTFHEVASAKPDLSSPAASASRLASVISCETARPRLETTAVSTSPLVKYPKSPISGAVSIAAAAVRACSAGVSDAVSSSNPPTSGTGSGGGSPAKAGSGGALSAASAARRAAARSPSSSVRFVEEKPRRPSRTTRIDTDSSWTSVG
jgi:hypothetical protein